MSDTLRVDKLAVVRALRPNAHQRGKDRDRGAVPGERAADRTRRTYPVRPGDVLTFGSARISGS